MLGKSVNKYYYRSLLEALCISLSKSKFNRHFNFLYSQAREIKYSSEQHIHFQVKVGVVSRHSKQPLHLIYEESRDTPKESPYPTLSSSTDVT